MASIEGQAQEIKVFLLLFQKKKSLPSSMPAHASIAQVGGLALISRSQPLKAWLMSDPRGWPFDSPDLLRVPFIFVPHGAPEPREWLARHPGAIKIAARLVPRGGADGRGALDADLNDALRPWLGGAGGDDMAAVAGPDQGDAKVPRHTRLADLLASNASGRGEAIPTGTPLDPALMKFLVGKYGDIAVQAAQMNADMSETFPKKWLAGWQKPQNVSAAGLPDPPPIHASSEARSRSAPPSDPAPRKLSQAEMLKLARMRAMLRLIRLDENGPVSDYDAYHARYGGADPMSDQDMIDYQAKDEKSINKRGTLEHHSAAGVYAITQLTWNEFSKVTGVKSFFPRDQDRAALYLINIEHATQDIEAGNLGEAIRKLKGRWPSLPGGKQTHTDLKDVKIEFDNFVGEEFRKIERQQASAKQ